jgi:hypothetical protein
MMARPASVSIGVIAATNHNVTCIYWLDEGGVFIVAKSTLRSDINIPLEALIPRGFDRHDGHAM